MGLLLFTRLIVKMRRFPPVIISSQGAGRGAREAIVCQNPLVVEDDGAAESNPERDIEGVDDHLGGNSLLRRPLLAHACSKRCPSPATRHRTHPRPAQIASLRTIVRLGHACLPWQLRRMPGAQYCLQTLSK